MDVLPRPTPLAAPSHETVCTALRTRGTPREQDAPPLHWPGEPADAFPCHLGQLSAPPRRLMPDHLPDTQARTVNVQSIGWTFFHSSSHLLDVLTPRQHSAAPACQSLKQRRAACALARGADGCCSAARARCGSFSGAPPLIGQSPTMPRHARVLSHRPIYWLDVLARLIPLAGRSL